jgi:hypothetical protein
MPNLEAALEQLERHEQNVLAGVEQLDRRLDALEQTTAALSDAQRRTTGARRAEIIDIPPPPPATADRLAEQLARLVGANEAADQHNRDLGRGQEEILQRVEATHRLLRERKPEDATFR